MADNALARWLERRGRRGRIVLLVAFGVMAALGQAPFGWPAVSLAGLALAVLAYSNARLARRAAWAGFAFGTGYFAGSLHWIVEPFFVQPWRHGWMAPFALILMSCGLALFWSAAFALAFRLRAGAVALVLTWTGAELLRAYVFSGFPWAMPAYGWVDGPVGQLAAWIGPHGVNFVVFSGAAGLAWMLRQRRWIAALGLVVAIGIGHWPLPQPEDMPNDRPLVRLIQPNAPQHQKWDPEHIPRFFGRSIDLTETGPRPDLIIWPETSIPVPLNYADQAIEVIATAANGVAVLAGIQRLDGLLLFNSAIVIDANGAVDQIYDKHHLVPFGEYLPFGALMSKLGWYGLAAGDGNGYAAGPGPALLDLGRLGKALPLICYEAVFPQDVAAAPERPDVIVQITNDAWFGQFSGPFQHLAQARMRAIEQGLPVIRSANTGVSGVIDARGRMLTQIDLGQAGFVDAAVPVALPATLYARSGDWPLTLSLLGLLSLLALRRVAIRN